ncbi:MAG: choice-of-anchor Q domain-containing protein, partial [Anaerolineales bacterium]|nr:choice-of-anchor Q domain-containing protein [Anaerolineales bacterium]
NGGGVYSASGASLTLMNAAQVTTNTASYSGAGIYAAVDSGAAFSMSDTTVDHNITSLGDGAGLYLPNSGAGAAGTITIFRSAITNNSAWGGSGGGLFIAASANITRTYIANNTLSGFTGTGGGMKIYEGGAGFKPITVSVTNVTVSGNTALSQGGGVDVSLQQVADAVSFNNVTIADNHRNVMPGPPAPYGGGGIYASGAELPDMLNTIVAGNTSGVGGADCEGAFHTLDYNLIQNTANCTFTGTTTHHVSGVSANLGALTTVNGAMVMVPQYGSPAIDAGNDFTCANQDQLGVNRPIGTHCDMGAYEADSVAPTVASIVRASANPTSKLSVDFTVAFSEAVAGVDAADFQLTLAGAAVTAVTHVTDLVYTVTVSTGSSNGSLRLDVPNTAAITDLVGNPLAGLPYAGGETYTVNKVALFRSLGAQDGWILETGENTNIGGAVNAGAPAFRVGDDAARRQYRGILSFSTGSALPDNAVITSVTLRVRRQNIVGVGNPLVTLQGFMADMRLGTFNAAALQPVDFQLGANKSYGPFKPGLVGGWYNINLTSGRAYVNKLATNGGLTQIRLRFKLDDNNDAIANYFNLFSGNAAVAYRPQLIVKYYVP